jgi:hypothetical protein
MPINNMKQSSNEGWTVNTADVLIREDTASQEATGNVSLAGKLVSEDVNTKPRLQRTISSDGDLSVCVYSRFNGIFPRGDSVLNVLMIDGYMSISKNYFKVAYHY